MKRFIQACLILSPIFLLAQAPQSFKYQAILRDADGAEQPNTSIQVRFQILQGSDSGPVVYCEEYPSVITNRFGLFTRDVGRGNLCSANNFTAINWGSGPHYLQVEVNGDDFGAPVQLLSVPYALYGKDEDHEPDNEIQTLSKSGNTVTLSNNGGSFIDEVNDGDSDPGNELQDWSTLPGIPAGFVDGIDNVDDNDNDPGNELQDWSTLPGIPAGFADGTDNVDDNDNDPGNELQDWSTLPGIPAGFADGIDDVDDGDWVLDGDVLHNANSGNVGIGTDNPTGVLHVGGDSNASAAGTGGLIVLGQADALNLAMDGNEILARNNGAPSGLGLQNEGGSVTIHGGIDSTIVHIANSGNVGIGTENPTEKLQVDNGMIRVTPDPDEPFGPVMKFVTPEGDSAQVKIFRGTDGRLYQDFDMLTSTDDQEARYRFFRHTNTTGSKAVNFLRGDGTNTASAHIGVDGEGSFFQKQGGDFVIGEKGGDDTNFEVYGDVVIRNDSTASGSRSFTLRTNIRSDLEFVGNGITIMTITDDEFPGNAANSVGIGVTPTAKLDVDGNAKIRGNLTLTDGGSCTGCSDKRFKCNLEPLAGTLEKLSQLNAIYYFWDTEAFPDRKFSEDRQVGVIAQELEQVYPELVFTDKEGYKSVAYGKLTPVLLSAIQEQQQQIEAQQAEIERLKADSEAMLDRLERIEAWIGQQETTAGK